MQDHKVCDEAMLTFDEIKELMKDAQSAKYRGVSFDEWLSANDGSRSSFLVWVGSAIKHGQVEDLRKAWEEIDGTISVGLGCTIYFYTDHKAATITDVVLGKSGKNKGLPIKVYVRKNKTICKDFYAGDYDVVDELEGGCYCFTKRRGCRWIEEGSSIHDGLELGIGYRDHYIDPCF